MMGKTIKELYFTTKKLSNIVITRPGVSVGVMWNKCQQSHICINVETEQSNLSLSHRHIWDGYIECLWLNYNIHVKDKIIIDSNK